MKLRPFELVLVVVFGVLFFAALILLKTFTPEEDVKVAAIGEVTIWGVLPEDAFSTVLKDIKDLDKAYEKVIYRYVPIEQFDTLFVNALADQKAPDIVLLPHDRLVEHRSRLQPISYESLPIRDYRSAFIDGTEIFALSDGIYGLPLLVDPLVLYWNRDMFATNNMLAAPKTWEEVVSKVVPTYTVKDFNRNILTSGLAMGEYSNVKNSYGVLSMLLLQGGSAMVTEAENQYQVLLNDRVGQTGGEPLTSAITFFTNFSNVNNSLYSWNRSLRQDKDMFLSEDLALYFGFASEGVDIAAKNPNLSFDIAEVPQSESASVRRTYGNFYAFTISRQSKNKSGAFLVASYLASEPIALKLAQGYNMVPARRSSVAAGSNDIFGRVAYLSAPNTRGWLNPDLDKASQIIATAIDDVNANRGSAGLAATDIREKMTDQF